MATHSSVLAWRIPGTEGAWWAAICGVAQSQTWLKRLSSSSSSYTHLWKPVKMKLKWLSHYLQKKDHFTVTFRKSYAFMHLFNKYWTHSTSMCCTLVWALGRNNDGTVRVSEVQLRKAVNQSAADNSQTSLTCLSHWLRLWNARQGALFDLESKS